MLITQALDLAQHTASAYHQAPDHIRRMLNQLFCDHVYLVPDQDTDQLTTTATCLPPFDSILRWRATADVESTEGAVVERRKSEGVERTEGVRGSALDEPANLGKWQGETKVIDDEGSAEGMGRARPGPTPTADEVERDDEVGTTDLIAPQAAHITARSARLDGSELAETSQNTPVSVQKPTSWDDHDVGLSAMQLVGAPLSHSNLWGQCWRYVMQHASEEVRQLQQDQRRGMVGNEREGTTPEGGAATGAAQQQTPSGAEVVQQAETSATATSDTAARPGRPVRRINRRLRPEVVEQMVQLRRDGHTVKEIAQQFGFHRETVATHLKRAGLTLRTSLQDEAFCQRVRQTYETIGTVKGTAQQLGVSKDTVRKVLQR